MRIGFSLLCLIMMVTAAPAWAVTYTNATTGTLDGTTTCGGNERVRTFTVPLTFNVVDVDLAFQATHSWRGDIRATLIGPTGISVELLSPVVTAAGNVDNYNIVFDDAATTPVNTGTHAGPDTATAPPFGQSVQPANPLAAFNNSPAQGTWRLELCDEFPTADNGVFGRAELRLTEDPAPLPPTALACNGTQVQNFDWAAPGQANGWTAGTLMNGYGFPDGTPLSITVSDPSGRLIARNGVATPVTSDEFTGGNPTSNESLALYADFASRQETLSIVMTIGLPGRGVDAIAFDIFDVDRNGWTDQVTVTGSLGGTATPVQLRGAAFNTIDANIATGVAQALSTSGAASVEALFTSAVDQVVITYGNGPGDTANPSAQIMSFFANLRACPVPEAQLSAIKTVELPGASGAPLFMTPGQEIIYKIAVTNGASATAAADGIDLSDILPENLTYVSAVATGFTGGTISGPAANTDCAGNACTVALTGASLPPDTTGELRVTVRIQ